MSLQVWLPLTKDLRQQGISSAIATNSGATYSSTGGKLGGYYSFDGVDDAITVGNLSTLVTDNFSFVCWFYHDDTWSSKNYETIFGGPSGFELEAKSGSTNSPVIRAYSWGQGTFTYELNKWNHLVMTRTTSETKFYLNGELKLTGTAGTIPSGNYFIGSWSSTTSQNFKGKMNDVRIYDHCLSPMEVKELAKGLVLHYSLNRQGFGQENLMPNSIEMPVGSANPSTGTWRLAGSSQMTRSRVAISDAPSGASTYGFQSVGLQTGQDASCWGIDGFPRENGATYTLSAWGRIVDGSSTAAMLGFSVYSGTTLDYGGTYGKAKSSDTKYYGSGAYDYAGGQLNPNGNWTRIYRTFTSTSASDNIYIGFNTAKTGSNVTLQLCGVKLEKGDKMTPWIPNSNESMYTTLGLDGTTEYDCSGFCNNGEKIGSLTYTSNSPKYDVSTHISATNQKIHISNLPTSGFGNSYTFAWWGKRSSNSPMFWGFSDGIRLNGMYAGYLWNTGDSSNNPLYNIGTTTQVTAPSVNVWHHYVMTGNGTKCYVYLDGVLWAEAKTYKAISGTSIYINGWDSSTSYGTTDTDISDFRIYATALSADDVLELYQQKRLN